MNKSCITLIGFMGTGKSTVGRIVAKKLSKQFVEMDDEIVKTAGKSIPQIFKEDGEIVFREFEIQICKKLSQKQNLVISAGGGIVLNKINLDYLNLNSIIICLNSRPDVIFNRIMKNGKESRPLLSNPDPKASIKSLLDYRKPLYDRATPYHIETSDLSVEEVVEEVIKIYNSQLMKD